MEEIGEEEEFSRQLTKVESVTTFPGNALVRELGDNAELWPPPPTGWQRSDHSDSHACIIVQPDMYLVSRNVSFRIVSRAKRGISKNASDIFFFLDHLLTHELNCIYIYIYIPHARFPLSFLYREERFSRRCGLIGGLRPLSPLPFLIYEAECCRVTNAEYRLNFKTKFRRVGGMVNSRDGAFVVPNNYMRLYR